MFLQKKIKNFLGFITYHVKEKWRFVYFKIKLDSRFDDYNKPNNKIIIRLANSDDFIKIKRSIFQHIGNNEKKELSEIDNNRLICFIAEKGGAIVHYALVYPDALFSPVIQTPVDKRIISDRCAYLSTAYTIERERGEALHLYVLLYILHYLKVKLNIDCAINLVHLDTLNAIKYFNRVGFYEIYRSNIMRWLIKTLKDFFYVKGSL